MEGRLLLKGCSVFRADGRIRGGMAVLVEDGRISRVAADEAVPTLPGDWEVACRGRLVAPGLVDCHTHLVGGQVLPLSGELLLRSPGARQAMEEQLSSSLTPGEVEVLTAYAAAMALRSGVTLAVEHLYAPAHVSQSLAAQARAAEQVGIRLVNSHATRSGGDGLGPLAQLEANVDHVRQYQKHPRVRGALGFHASSSCDDDLLRRLGRFRSELGVGVHFHLAETEDDVTATFSRYGRRIVPRLESFGLLGAAGVAAYAKAIDHSEATRLEDTRTLVALSPRASLLTEQVGSGFEALLSLESLAGLGTGGTGSLWGELDCAFVGAMNVARKGRLLDPDGLLAQLLFDGPAELCSMVFGAPSGSVEEGGLADLVVYDVVPAEASDGGLLPQLLLQLGHAPVGWTIVGGRVVVREGQLLTADDVDLATEAAKALRAVRERGASAASSSGRL